MGLLRGLSIFHEVTLISFTDQPDLTVDIPEIQSVCREVYTIPWKEFNPQSWRAKLGFFSIQPRFLIDTFSKDMAELISRLILRERYDLIIASQLSMASYHSFFDGIPAIFEEVELGQFKHDPAGGFVRHIRNYLTWFKLRKYMNRLLDAFYACTVASNREYQLLVEACSRQKDKISILPNCIAFDTYQGLEVNQVQDRLIYTGSFRFYANYEAMQWFVGKVFSLILEKKPETQLLITGDHAKLSLSSNENITFTGYVDDIKSVIASSSISLAPLLSGGGTRLKILEAMALGVPVVSTSKGAEGLGAISGKHILIADSPQDFANQIIRLLSDPELYAYISKNGQRLVKEKYDWNVVMPSFLRLVDIAIG